VWLACSFHWGKLIPCQWFPYEIKKQGCGCRIGEASFMLFNSIWFEEHEAARSRSEYEQDQDCSEIDPCLWKHGWFQQRIILPQLISTGYEPNDCYYCWHWQANSSPNREESHYVGFLDESKTPEEGSLARCRHWSLLLKKSKRNAMHSSSFSVLYLNQFYPEFSMQQLRTTCGETLREYGSEHCGRNWRWDSSFQILKWINGRSLQRIQTNYCKAQECWRRYECNKCCTCCTAHFLWHVRAKSTWENSSIEQWSCEADSRKHWV